MAQLSHKNGSLTINPVLEEDCYCVDVEILEGVNRYVRRFHVHTYQEGDAGFREISKCFQAIFHLNTLITNEPPEMRTYICFRAGYKNFTTILSSSKVHGLTLQIIAESQPSIYARLNLKVELQDVIECGQNLENELGRFSHL